MASLMCNIAVAHRDLSRCSISRTLAFAEYPGNRQFITSGNLAENARAFLFLMDYANARRLKLWGSARTTEEPDTVARVTTASAPETGRAILFTVRASDWNCSKYIPRPVAPTGTEFES